MGITVPPDSTGKTVETNSPDGATQRQVVTLGDKTTAANTATVLASGAVKTEPGGVNVQPISGTVTANIGTSGSLALDATVSETHTSAGGTTASGKIEIVGGKTSDVTPQYQPIPLTNSGAAVKVDASATTQPVSGTFWQATQPVSGTVTVQQSTATNLKVDLSGTAANATAIKVDGSAVTQPVSGAFFQATQPVSGTVTSNQGTANTAANAWPAKITDGTNVAAVKAASTAAAATDPAVVVAVSPNNSVAVTGTFFQGTQPVSGTVTVQQATAANLKVDLSGTAANATAIKVDGSAVTQPVSIATAPVLVAGAAIIGKVGIDQTTPGTTNGVQTIAGTSGGWSVNSQTALTTTKIAVKASAGNFGGYMVYNPNATAVFIQVFDVASASVTLGTTAPTYVIPLPGTSAANVEFKLGITHTTAITLAATTTATGLTAPGTALTGFFLFK